MSKKPSLFHDTRSHLHSIFSNDAAAGVILIAVTLAALAVANSPLAEMYHAAFHGILSWTPIAKLDTLHLWINDGLMAVFFLVVGLEVKREIMEGNLANPRTRRLPVLAAIGGMAIPACFYLLAVGGDAEMQRGWAIPAATDIAFAMGVVALLGSRIPSSLRLFLLTVAIVDDIGAVLIIALFYTATLKLGWLLASAAIVVLMLAFNRLRVDRLSIYLLAALALWFCVLNSGIHATVAGVVAALTIPMRRRDGSRLLERLEHALSSWNAFLIVPLFGFANAGLSLAGLGPSALLDPLPLAVATGLVLGKPIGIFGSVALAHGLGIAHRPKGASWLQIAGVAVLCGIGFTMSLFIGALAFPTHPQWIEEAKLGVLAGSLLSALMGYALLRLAPPLRVSMTTQGGA